MGKNKKGKEGGTVFHFLGGRERETKRISPGPKGKRGKKQKGTERYFFPCPYPISRKKEGVEEWRYTSGGRRRKKLCPYNNGAKKKN